MSLYCKTKIITPLMHNVLDGGMMKSEMLPHLSVAKRGYVSESDLAEVIPHVLYKLSAWLPMADYFCVCMRLSPLAVGLHARQPLELAVASARVLCAVAHSRVHAA